MYYRVESEMYESVMQQIPLLLKLETPYATAREVAVSYRRADIGLMELSDPTLESIHASALARLDVGKLWMLAVVLAQSTCEADDVTMARKLLQFSDEKARESLPESLITVDEYGNTRACNWLEDRLGSVVFVELKLRRWQEALKQAKFYLTRAHASCVVLDDSVIEEVDLDAFRIAGVGLIGARKDKLSLHVEPVVNSRTSVHSIFNSLRVLGDLASSRPRKWQVET